MYLNGMRKWVFSNNNIELKATFSSPAQNCRSLQWQLNQGVVLCAYKKEVPEFIASAFSTSNDILLADLWKPIRNIIQGLDSRRLDVVSAEIFCVLMGA
ncbi:hypothetical protein PHMEG_00013045 [Phytophthora megakarya]|uniref:Uncharacterized protein n=1 Tax=Phytophthora megakarya TaxID=4795 RepID=A0A225W772_9STRA|nr:hypothetical protein PHMEG_00013045 [Phytophthora megakarya]